MYRFNCDVLKKGTFNIYYYNKGYEVAIVKKDN